VKASPAVHNLNAGEFSPFLTGRSDIARYANSLRLAINFILLAQGPAQRRGGTTFVSAKKDDDQRAWLVRFEFSATQAWVLEFGDEYVRFYTNHGQAVVSSVAAWSAVPQYTLGDLVEDGGVNYYCIATNTNQQPPNATYWYPLEDDIYEIPSPYALADLEMDDGTFALSIEQSADVLYIGNRNRTIVAQTLTRYGNTDWRFEEYNPDTGPFLELNTTAKTMYASANTGSVTLTATAGTFVSTDVGRLVRLEVQDQDVQPWETDKAYSLNDLVRYDGKTYKCTDAGTSGTDPPVHEHGKAYDGQSASACQWDYQNAGYAIFRITAFTSGAEVTATVIEDEENGLRYVPSQLVGAPASNPSKRWQLGAWSDTTEYPGAVCIWRDRLWWGGEIRYWGSVPAEFDNMIGDFFGEVRADNAIWRTLQAQDVNEIDFMADVGDLIIGTPGGEFVVSEITNAQPLAPANIKHKRQSKERTRGVKPISVGSKLLYVQRAGRKLYEIGYDFNTDRYRSVDLAIFADRMPRVGIVDMAYQSEPFPVVWCVLTDGSLIAVTYDQNQEVTGWHRHKIGGQNAAVEGIACIPAPDGLHDEVWLLVRRTINDATVRYVEYMRRPWEGKDNDGLGGDDPRDAFYVDSGLTYTAASTTILISGVSIISAPDVGTHILVTTTTAHRLIAGATITISGMTATGGYNLNGEQLVSQVMSATQFRIYKKNINTMGSYTSGGQFETLQALSTTITGLDHLIGQTVQVLADAAPLPDQVVDASGEITISGTPAIVHVGLGCPARLVTSDLESGGPAGTSMGKTSRINRCAVRFVDTLGGKIGKPDSDLSLPSVLDDIEIRVPADPMGSAPPYRTGFADLVFPGDWDREKLVEIAQDQPLPMTVAQILPRVNTHDS